MANVVDLPEVADEGEASLLTALFYDLSGEQLDAQALISLTLTLQNEADASIINDRDDQTILNENGGSVAADGTLTLTLSELDNVIVGNTRAKERHIATLKWSYVDINTVEQHGIQKYRLWVAAKVTAKNTLPAEWVG